MWDDQAGPDGRTFICVLSHTPADVTHTPADVTHMPADVTHTHPCRRRGSPQTRREDVCRPGSGPCHGLPVPRLRPPGTMPTSLLSDQGLTRVMLATSLTKAMAFSGWNLQVPSCAGWRRAQSSAAGCGLRPPPCRSRTRTEQSHKRMSAGSSPAHPGRCLTQPKETWKKQNQGRPGRAGEGARQAREPHYGQGRRGGSDITPRAHREAAAQH